MAKKRNPLKNIRLVYQRSSSLVKCIVIATIVVCSVCLLALRLELLQAKSDYEANRHTAAKSEQENKALENYIDLLGTVDGIKHIARTELGLVPPDTIFFVPTDSTCE